MPVSLLAFAFLMLLKVADATDPMIYIGCYKDQDVRSMGFLVSEDDPTMTVQKCVDACFKQGYAFAGLQVGQECRCGNSYDMHGVYDGCSNTCEDGFDRLDADTGNHGRAAKCSDNEVRKSRPSKTYHDGLSCPHDISPGTLCTHIHPYVV